MNSDENSDAKMTKKYTNQLNITEIKTCLLLLNKIVNYSNVEKIYVHISILER